MDHHGGARFVLRRRGWCALTLASLLCAGCASSHRADDGLDSVAGDLDHGDAAVELTDPVATHCGVSDPELPALLGVDGHEVWLQWLDGRRQLAHGFDQADPAFAPDVVPAWWSAGEHILISVGGRFTGHGISPQARVLLKRSGQLLWARSWPTATGGVLTELGSDGSLLMEDGNGHVWVRPDGTERHLPPGFVPFHTPGADGWFGGVFSDRDTATGYGFQHAETDERRSLARDIRSETLQVGRPELIDGRFYYAVVDATGVAAVAVEGPDLDMALSIEGETELLDLLPGPTHTLIHRGNRPLALLERATLELTRLDALPPDARDVHLRVDGEWFTAIVQPGPAPFDPDATHPFHVAPLERAYRVHAPSATLDSTPLPSLPGGLSRYEYTSCTWVTEGWSIDGQLTQSLAPLDVAEPAPAQLFVESEDGERWEPLGSPVIFGIDPRAHRVGDTLLLRTDDARNRYCAERPTSEPGVPLPEALAGKTVQVVAPDGQAFGFDTSADQIDVLEHDVSLSVDGNCALITGGGESRIHDLLTHEEQPLDLRDPHWLQPFSAGYTGW